MLCPASPEPIRLAPHLRARETLAAIIFVATSGRNWRQLPPVFGPAWPTVCRRFAQWSRDQARAKRHRVLLDELGARSDLDWFGARSTPLVSGPQRGPLTGPNPTDRGKSGSKIHLITDQNGLPLSLGISAANTHHSLSVLRLVGALLEPEISAPRVVGVDEYATREGRHYGTVLVEIETRRPVDLLPDREASSLAPGSPNGRASKMRLPELHPTPVVVLLQHTHRGCSPAAYVAAVWCCRWVAPQLSPCG
ncbi:hypothetical protein GCM10018980_71300 [Streptomyces capoamus]|uniref:Insertion element IS402-like domain-containing protein n=1 Tax=Streptomyces capoamus TaxID=68183 RepID=A0A919F305_9ACTN|nr:hypothetical protein GCM10010501_15930 [Streptomyces libani subsp. rufus]GHG74421.1 hypothetical protein GCM10018980_71300 [Streptomyces capoamus]